MLIIVGLGNPGLKYRKTFHNTGFAVVDKLVASRGGSFKRSICKGKICELYVGGETVVVAKPQTYMNLSGECVRELMGRYHAKPEEVIIVYDDIDLGVGELRMREHGSAGSHNGMRSIVSLCGDKMPRLRVGIGKPVGMQPLYDYVLSQPKGEVATALTAGIERAAAVLDAYIKERSISKAMQVLQ